MSTPTPRTDAAWSATFDSEQISAGKTARTLREHSQQLETELAAITAERDQLKEKAKDDFEMFHGLRMKLTAACGDPYKLHDEALDDIISERDQLRADCENETKWAAHYLAESIAVKAELKDLKSAGGPPFIRSEAIRNLRDQVCGLKARAERAEATETVALANWNGALERALKAEADLAAEREKSERYRLATLKLDAALATEREKVRLLRSALQNLADEQNGAPLETRRAHWQMAMDECGLALAVTEAKP